MVKSKVLGLIYALLCVVLWSFIPVISRFGQVKLDNFQFLFWSNLLSLIVVSLAAIYFKKLNNIRNIRKEKIIQLVLLGTIGCAFYYLCLYYGYAHAKVIEVLIVQYSWPFLIVILSTFLLKEKLTFISFLSACLGFLGIGIVLTKGNLYSVNLSNISANFIVFIGSFSCALFSVLSKKIQEEEYTTTVLYFIGGVFLSTLSMLLISRFSFPSVGELVPVIINGAFINGVSYIFWLKSLSLIPASVAAILVFFTPVISTFLIIVIFQEPFLWSYGAGLLMVLTAGFLANKQRD